MTATREAVSQAAIAADFRLKPLLRTCVVSTRMEIRHGSLRQNRPGLSFALAARGLQAADGEKVVLRTSSGRYLRTEPDGSLRAQRWFPTEEETFRTGRPRRRRGVSEGLSRSMAPACRPCRPHASAPPPHRRDSPCWSAERETARRRFRSRASAGRRRWTLAHRRVRGEAGGKTGGKTGVRKRAARADAGNLRCQRSPGESPLHAGFAGPWAGGGRASRQGVRQAHDPQAGEIHRPAHAPRPAAGEAAPPAELRGAVPDQGPLGQRAPRSRSCTCRTWRTASNAVRGG